MGLLVCGLNGSGKSTLGRALAEALRLRFLDSEALYFPEGRFDAPRTQEEFLAALDAATREGDFVFASVRGNGAQWLPARVSHAVWVDAPRETRLQRVRERSYRRFGARMLPGGDLYESEEAFFAQVESRSDEEMLAFAERLPCPVLRVDGTRPLRALVPEVCAWISQTTEGSEGSLWKRP